MDKKILLVNPLGAALKHYTASLEKLLTDAGAHVTSVALMEPSTPGQSHRRWIIEYIKTLRAEARKGSDDSSSFLVIQTWPILGYWDHLVLRLLLRRTPALIVLHDPYPLVRAIGYGRVARWAASQDVTRAAAIVHSDAAADVVRKCTSLRDVIDLPHPMFPPQQPTSHGSRETVIRTLGQYKADRDLDCMEKLAAHGPSEWRYEVVGRGWPAIPGWTITNRFVSEEEFDAYLRSSSAIIIPYVRFFQSGVAIRSLEVGTPVVGPRTSSLAALLGQDSTWLAGDGSWLRAVEAAAKADPQNVYRAASSIYGNTLKQWRTWLDLHT